MSCAGTPMSTGLLIYLAIIMFCMFMSLFEPARSNRPALFEPIVDQVGQKTVCRPSGGGGGNPIPPTPAAPNNKEQEGYSIVPKHRSQCRIFQRALYQGGCGACLSFAIVTAIAMRACLQQGEDFIMSPFRMHDCHNATCDRGISFRHIRFPLNKTALGDIDASEHSYGKQCHMHASYENPVPHIIANYQQIKNAVRRHGPILASIYADLMIRDPITGVYRHTEAEQWLVLHEATHMVVLLGWDAQDNWIVQNSWGETWGDGYGRGRIAQDVLAYVQDPRFELSAVW